MSTLREEALKIHKKYQGKLGVHSKIPVQDANDLSLAYSPGVAEPCLDIHEDESKVYDYTMKGAALETGVSQKHVNVEEIKKNLLLVEEKQPIFL